MTISAQENVVQASRRWLLVAGTISLLLAFAVFCCWAPLTVEEQRLVGRWEVIEHAKSEPMVIFDFQSDRKQYQRVPQTNESILFGDCYWRIRNGLLNVVEVEPLTTENLWTNRTLMTLEWTLEWTGHDELRLAYPDSSVFVLRRLSD